MSVKRRNGNVWVLWHGGANYAAPAVLDAEVWPWADVVSNMLDRYHNWDGSTPCVDESSEAHVFYADPRDSSDPYPDEVVVWSRYHNTYRRGAC